MDAETQAELDKLRAQVDELRGNAGKSWRAKIEANPLEWARIIGTAALIVGIALGFGAHWIL